MIEPRAMAERSRTCGDENDAHRGLPVQAEVAPANSAIHIDRGFRRFQKIGLGRETKR